MHTVELEYAVCIPPWSQAPQCASHRGVKWPKFLEKLCGVRIEMFKSLCLIWKWQSGEILLGVNTSTVSWKKKFEDKFFDLLSLKFLLTPRSRIFQTLRSNISLKTKPNSKILYPVYQGPIWVRIMEKNRGQKSRDTLHLSIYNVN